MISICGFVRYAYGEESDNGCYQVESRMRRFPGVFSAVNSWLQRKPAMLVLTRYPPDSWGMRTWSPGMKR